MMSSSSVKRYILFILAACLLSHAVADAQILMPLRVMGNGGGASSIPGFRLNGTVSQMAIGVTNNNMHRQLGGFWYQVQASSHPPLALLSLSQVSGAPGDTIRVAAVLTNLTPSPVGGLQFIVILDDTTAVHFIGLEDTLSNPGFSVSQATSADSTSLLIYSGSFAVIHPGTDIHLVTLVYALDQGAIPGSIINLLLAGVEIGDSYAVAMADSSINGAITVTGEGADSVVAQLRLGAVACLPGGPASLSLILDNPTGRPVGALQFRLVPDKPGYVQFNSIVDSVSDLGFQVNTNTTNDTTTVLIHTIQDVSLSPGTRKLGQAVYQVEPSAPSGSTISIAVTQIVMGDTLAIPITTTGVAGAIYVGARPGDLNNDGAVNALDIVLLVRVILGKNPWPSSGSIAYFRADANGDGGIDVVDVIWQVNNILGIAQKPVVSGPTAPVTVELGESHALSDGSVAIPLVLDANGVVAGVQVVFTFDSSLLDVGAPQLAGTSTGLAFDSHEIVDTLRVVAYGPTPGAGIPASKGAVLQIPVTVKEGVKRTPSLTLAEIILVDPQAQRIPIQLGKTSVLVTKIAPTSFALHDVRPNPFNPTTTIAYDVPQQAHITLTIYNLLGQEVARLVDRVHSPGRYTVTWNGRNAQGVGVASGVYVYRLVSSTGFIQSKRMSLVK